MTRRTIAIVLVAVAGVAIVWWSISRRPNSAASTSPSTTGDTSAMAGMPGMTAASGDGAVSLTADQIRDFGVTFAVVEERTLESTVRATGVVVVDETRVAQITSRVPGFVERLDVNFTGQVVRRGQPLYALYSPELVAAQDELLAAARLARSTNAGLMPGVSGGPGVLLKAAKRRLRLWDVSEAQIAEVLRRDASQRAITFQSPIAGVVVQKAVMRGQAIQQGQMLYTIADLGRVWVEADLREGEASGVVQGSSAEVELAAFPGRHVSGRVTFIAPVLEPESRAIRARIEVPNADGRLKPGMYGTVRIVTAGQRAKTVPTAAVVHTGERSIVFVDIGSGRLAAREVIPGRAAGVMTEIRSGLEAGQRVVTSAQFLLESESNLSEIMRSMIGQAGVRGAQGIEGMDMRSGAGLRDSGAGANGADMRGTPGMDLPKPRN